MARAVVDPYAAVIPYATWEFAATLVVQLMVALEELTEVKFTAEMTGAPNDVVDDDRYGGDPDISLRRRSQLPKVYARRWGTESYQYWRCKPGRLQPRLPEFAPSICNCTPAMLSDPEPVAVAETVSLPDTVDPAEGAVMETVGALDELDACVDDASSMAPIDGGFANALPSRSLVAEPAEPECNAGDDGCKEKLYDITDAVPVGSTLVNFGSPLMHVPDKLEKLEAHVLQL